MKDYSELLKTLDAGAEFVRRHIPDDARARLYSEAAAAIRELMERARGLRSIILGTVDGIRNAGYGELAEFLLNELGEVDETHPPHPQEVSPEEQADGPQEAAPEA